MVNALEVNPNELVERTAKQLEEKKIVSPPAWAGYVKTSPHTERPPAREDWWYMRAAAILRSVYRLGPVGTGKLRVKYGGRKNRGYKPEKFFRSGGSIIRKVMQQLEQSGLLATQKQGSHKGRVVTAKGKSFLDKIAVQISKDGPKEKRKEIKLVNVKVEQITEAEEK